MARSFLFAIQSNSIRPSAMTSGLYGCHIVINYYQEVYSAGVTKVSWDFYTGYAPIENSTASTWAARATARTNVYATVGEISNITGTEYDSGSGNNVAFVTTGGVAANTYLGSGSCLIKHNSSGDATFKVVVRGETTVSGNKCGFWIGGWGDQGQLNPTQGTTFTVDLKNNKHYTNCGAPTTVSASGIITPSGSFTVSWSGASAGTANSIAGYRIYYAITSNGAIPSESSSYVDVSSTATSGSKTITLSNATRGYKVVCGVQTRGSAGSSYYSGLKTGGLVTINSLPAAPSVSMDKTKLPSSGGTVTFTVTAGADSDDSQTKTLYYSTSASGTRTKFTSPLKPTVTSGSTYYFWTHDGLEYSSSYASKTITINQKPELTIDFQGTSLSSVNNTTSQKYVISPKITLTATKGQSNKKYWCSIKYGKNINSLTTTKKLWENSTTTQKSYSNLRSELLDHETEGVYYKVEAYCNDGIENSNTVSSEIYYITKTPQLIGIYNQSGYTNVEGFYNNQFATHYLNYIGLVFQYDQGFEYVKFNTYEGSYELKLTPDQQKTKLRAEVTNSTEVNSPQSVTLNYSIGQKGAYYSSGKEVGLTKIAKISPTNLNVNQVIGTYKYFTGFNNTYNISVNPSFGNDPTKSNLDYGIYIKDKNLNYLKGELSIGSVKAEFNITEFNGDDGAIKFILKPSYYNGDLFDKIDNKNKEYETTLNLIFTNNFGVSYSISGKFKTSYIELEATEITQKKMYTSEDTEKNPIDYWAYLKQGMGNLLGDFTVKTYNTSPSIIIQSSYDKGKNWVDLVTLYMDLDPESDKLQPGTRATYTVTGALIKEIGEIKDKKYTVSYRAKIKTDAGTQNEEKDLYEDIVVKGHFSPILLIKNNTCEDGNLKIKYDIQETGADMEFLTTETINDDLSLVGNLILVEEGGESEGIDFSSKNYFENLSNKEATFYNYNFEGKESKLVKLKITTSLGTYPKNSTEEKEFFVTKKTSDVSIIDNVIFNLVPTVSYRKNHLGINVLNPDSSDKKNAILIIGETRSENISRDTIYFQTAGSNLCKVVNFLLDGGTW